MSRVIRLPAEIYSRLEVYAKGFDTPANVIEKLLNHYEGVEQASSANSDNHAKNRTRDSSKYLFNQHTYGKGRLVLAVVKDYISKNPDTPFDELLNVLPKHLQGSSGVFVRQDDAQEIYDRTGHKRNFIKPNELIQLTDCVIAVSAEWGAGNINKFIQHVKSIGYEILPTNS